MQDPKQPKRGARKTIGPQKVKRSRVRWQVARKSLTRLDPGADMPPEWEDSLCGRVTEILANAARDAVEGIIEVEVLAPKAASLFPEIVLGRLDADDAIREAIEGILRAATGEKILPLPSEWGWEITFRRIGGVDLTRGGSHSHSVDVEPEARQEPGKGGQQRAVEGGAEAAMPRLDLAELAGRVDLRPEELRRLGERVGELMRPLLEALPELVDEFGVGGIDRGAVRRNVWALIEENLRASLAVGETSEQDPEGVDRDLSARQTADRLRAIHDPQRIQDFLDRFVVGRSWGTADNNYLIATGVSDHLRSLKLRVQCPNDGEPAILRCYPATWQQTGSFVFEHRVEKKTQRHVGSAVVPPLKVVPEAPDPRRRGVSS